MLSILQICNRFPYPPKDGGAIAMYNNTKAFYELGCKTDLLVINTKKHYVNVPELPSFFLSMLNRVEWINANTDINPFDAFLNLFSSESYNLKRFNLKDFESKLIDLLKNNHYDIIHIEGLFVSVYVDIIRKYSKAKISLRAHNVEYLIWERMASSTNLLPKKWYLNLLARRLKKFEIDVINKVDLLVPITELDATIFKKHGCKSPIFVSPAGVDEETILNEPFIQTQLSLFHIGALDWMPNLQAVNWFLAEIWPLVNSKFPTLKFYIAGRRMPKKIKNMKLPNVEIVGEVDDAIKFINSKSIMIVPLLSGSGMRIKIIEGMGMGKTIISTEVGAEGIDYNENMDILIANTPDEFLNKISFAMENPYVCEQIGQNAINLIRTKYSNKILIGNLINYYKKIALKSN